MCGLLRLKDRGQRHFSRVRSWPRDRIANADQDHGVVSTSGSLPRLPTRITLLTLPAMTESPFAMGVKLPPPSLNRYWLTKSSQAPRKYRIHREHPENIQSRVGRSPFLLLLPIGKNAERAGDANSANGPPSQIRSYAPCQCTGWAAGCITLSCFSRVPRYRGTFLRSN